MIPPLRPKAQYQLMKSMEEPSFSVDNAISTADAQYIYDTWKTTRADREYPAGFAVGDKSKKGSLKFPYSWSEFGEILEPIVNRILNRTDWWFVTGRLYYVSQQRVWDTIHTDCYNYLEKVWPDGAPNNNGSDLIGFLQKNPDKIYTPLKTIVIPLWHIGDVNTVVFNQFNHAVESVSWNKHKHRQQFPGPLTDYTEYLEDLHRDTITDADYEKYLKHVDRDLLRGLSIETVHDWQVGKALVWNSSQLHVSGHQPQGVEKVGITIWTAE